MNKISIPLFAFLLATLFSVPIFAADPLLPTGSEARKFLLLDTEGQRLGLKDWVGEKATHKKQLLLISFWSLSCVPCREELPRLQEFAANNSSNVALVMINLDSKDKSSEVIARKHQLKLSSTVLLDPYQVTGKNYNVCSAQGSCNVPALYGIDMHGNIVLSHAGYEGPENLEKLLKTALTASTAPISAQTTSLNRNALLLVVHQSAPLDAIAAKYGISKQELQKILKEAETAAREYWK